MHLRVSELSREREGQTWRSGHPRVVSPHCVCVGDEPQSMGHPCLFLRANGAFVASGNGACRLASRVSPDRDMCFEQRSHLQGADVIYNEPTFPALVRTLSDRRLCSDTTLVYLATMLVSSIKLPCDGDERFFRLTLEVCFFVGAAVEALCTLAWVPPVPFGAGLQPVLFDKFTPLPAMYSHTLGRRFF